MTTPPIPTPPPEIDPDAKPELGGTGGVGGPVPMRAAQPNTHLSDEALAHELHCAYYGTTKLRWPPTPRAVHEGYLAMARKARELLAPGSAA